MNIRSSTQDTNYPKSFASRAKTEEARPRLEPNDTISIGAHVLGGAALGAVPIVNGFGHLAIMSQTPSNEVGNAATILGMATIGASIATYVGVISEFSPWILAAPAAIGGLHAGLAAYSRTEAGKWQG